MNQAFRERHQDWRKTLATTMQPESLFYGHYFEEIVTFLKNQQARVKTFTFNLVLVCIYESPIPGQVNDTFRQGKFKTFIYSTYLEKMTSFCCIFKYSFFRRDWRDSVHLGMLEGSKITENFLACPISTHWTVPCSFKPFFNA